MTGNQLTYWRQQEEARANQTRESETQRHNVATEEHNARMADIEEFKNKLTEIGLNIRKAEDAAKVWELYSKYGSMAAAQVPRHVRQQIADAFGVKGWEQETKDSYFAQFWDELKRVNPIGNFIKGVSSLF